MAELTGANAYIIWIDTAGTITLSTDFRTFTHTQEQGEADKSAGADTQRTYLKTMTDGNIAISYLHDGGTTNWSRLNAGAEGTLVWGEAGTANNAPKHTQASFIKASNKDAPYDNVQIWNLQFRPTAARSDSFWTNGA